MDPIRPEGWLRFVQIDPFPGQWAGLGLGEVDLQALELLLLASPSAGAVVRGAGGLRKVRFTAPGSGRGKRGSYRVFYAHFPEHGHVLLWAVISKNQAADLTPADRNALAKGVARVKRLLDQGVIR
jgi:hypothetical protein